MTRIAIAVLCLLPTAALAEPTTMVIPGQQWQISFDAPALTKQEEADHPEQYKYFGNAGRFNLSMFVESPGCNGGTTHEAFYECLWPQASRNPMIVKESVTKACKKDYCKVTYNVEAPWKGRLIKQHNINFLIAYNGKWTDLHVSVIEPTDADLKLLDAFEQSLRYRKTEAIR